MHSHHACVPNTQNSTMTPSINCALSSRMQHIVMIIAMQANFHSPFLLRSSNLPWAALPRSRGAAHGTSGYLINPCKYAPPATSHRENPPWGSALPPKKLIWEGVPRGAKVQFCTPAPFVLMLGGCLLLSVVVCCGARPCCLSSISVLKLLCVAVRCCRAFLC